MVIIQNIIHSMIIIALSSKVIILRIVQGVISYSNLSMEKGLFMEKGMFFLNTSMICMIFLYDLGIWWNAAIV